MTGPLAYLFCKGVAAALIAATACSLLQNNRATASGIVFLPPDGGYDSQLGGAYPPAQGVTSVSRDRLSSPTKGLYSICYFNGFQTQAEETEWWKANHPDALLRGKDGELVEDKDWPGEVFLDTSTHEKRLAIFAVMGGWIQQCADKGFSAIEPDNLDSWSRSDGLLTMGNNLALMRLMSDFAHEIGLAVAQKNNAELGSEGKLLVGFDFAIAEECEAFQECDAYTAVYEHVLEIEYTDNDIAVFERACAERGAKIPIVLRDRELTTPDDKAYHFEMC